MIDMARIFRVPGYITCGFLICGLLLCTATTAQATAFNDPGARAGAAQAITGSDDIVPAEANVTGGSVSIGSSSQIVVLFRNESGRPMRTGAIQLYPSSTVSANVSLNQCGQDELPAGATCSIAILIKGLQPGAWRVEMIMRHSGRSQLVRAAMSGTVDAGDKGSDYFVSDIQAIPNELDFGSLKDSQPSIKGIVLRNTTAERIDISSAFIESSERAGYTLRTNCTSLDPGQACMVVVTWSPVLRGQSGGVLMIEHSGPTKISSINLKGSFEPEKATAVEVFPEAVPGKGLLVASQDEIDFGSSINTTSSITVSLVNTGDAPLRMSEVFMANADNGVSISKKGCTGGTILNPIEACPLTLSWSPVRAGPILDDVQIIHDGARGILVLPVRGEATGVVSQDNKAVRMVSTEPVSADPSVPAPPPVFQRKSEIDPASVLDGFIVTSHAPTRAIISGPSGSRIVFNRQEVVIGGFVWNVNIRSSGVEFRSGDQKVLLLFDKSLSSAGAGGSPSSAAAAPTQ